MARKIKHLGPDGKAYLLVNENDTIISDGDEIADNVWNSNLLHSLKAHINSI